MQNATATKTLDLTRLIQQLENEFRSAGYRGKVGKGGGVDNVLLLRLDAVGDFILSTPAIRAVRENYPNAFITLVVTKTVYPLAELCPYVNEVLIFDTQFNHNDIVEIIKRVTDFAKNNLWKRHYRLAFIIQYWMTKVNYFLTYFSGAAERIAYCGADFSAMLMTHRVAFSKKHIHDVTKNLNLLKDFGLKISTTYTEIWFDDEDLIAAENIFANFAKGRLKISVAIGSNSTQPARRYPVEKYLKAFKVLIDEGAAIVIFGGSAELEGAKFLEENLPAEFVKNFVEVGAGWRVDAAAMSLTDMYIGNFTGACDVAATLKLPIIALSPEAEDKEFLIAEAFSQYAQYYPWQIPAIVLRPAHQLDDCAEKIFYGGCQKNTSHCIAQIEPSEIVRAFDDMIYFIKYSGIKKINAPPIIKNRDELPKFGFEFENFLI